MAVSIGERPCQIGVDTGTVEQASLCEKSIEKEGPEPVAVGLKRPRAKSFHTALSASVEYGIGKPAPEGCPGGRTVLATLNP